MNLRPMWRNTIGLTLLWLALPSMTAARVVGVEDGSGSGFLFSHLGNCFLILPGHLHGVLRSGIRVGASEGGDIGTANIVYQASGDADISLALVRGGVARDCGPEWSDLPRSLSAEIDVGRIAVLERARQKSREGRRVLIHTTNFQQIRLVPAEGEAADLFGGTSGAVAFLNGVPIGMVLDAESTEAAWALRMDEIINLLSRFMGEVPPSDECASGGVLAESCSEPVMPAAGEAFEVTTWSVHPVEGAADPTAMAAGAGPYIAPLASGAAVTIELRLIDTDRLSRIRIFTEPDEKTAVPKAIEVVTDTSEGGGRRPNPMPRRDMSPDGIYDNHVGERFAKTVTIRVSSTWSGGSPVRIDRIVID